MSTANTLIKVAILFLFSLVTVTANAQVNNSCTYSYSFGSGDSYFSFCLTPYGTLASLQGVGGELLDPTNPIEGFVLCDTSGYDLFSDQTTIPGLGYVDGGLPAVAQPNGVGKLPIIFTFDLSYTTVTASPSEKKVIFSTPLGKFEAGPYEYANVIWVRVAVLGSNSANFSYSASMAFGYTTPGGLAAIDGYAVQGKLRDDAYPFVSAGQMVQQCGVGMSEPFTGTGAIAATGGFETNAKQTTTFSYKVF
jgi:hypothetical protein